MLDLQRGQRPLTSKVQKSLPSLPESYDSNSMSCGCINNDTMESNAVLIEKCKQGSLTEVKDVVEKYANSSVIGALHQASARGAVDIVTYLVDQHAKVNTED